MEVILSVILVLVVGFFGLQFYMVWKMRRQQGKPAPADLGGKAGKLIKNGKKALFYFYSPACRMCRTTTPVVQDMSKTRDNVIPVDISQDMATARKFGVMGTPSTIIVNNGVIETFRVGPIPETELRAMAN